MRAHFGWSAGLAMVVLAGLISCSDDDDGPVDPEPDATGSIRATVTGDGASLPGVTVRVFASGGTTALESGSTAANGQIVFDDLDTGEYDVEVVIPAGFVLVAGQTAVRDVTVEEDETATVTFALAEEIVAPTVGQIRAEVLDGATPISGVEVNLYDAGGSTALTTLSTGANGQVLFEELEPADYDVEIELPVDFEMADGDTARKEATVVAGETAEVDFAVNGPNAMFAEVTAGGTSFTPDDVTIAVGGTVRWVWQSNPHTVTPSGHSEWTEVNLNSSGDQFEHMFDTAGEYDYLCTVHPGMTGVIRVE